MGEIENDDIEWVAPVSVRVLDALDRICELADFSGERLGLLEDIALVEGWCERTRCTPFEERWNPPRPDDFFEEE